MVAKKKKEPTKKKSEPAMDSFPSAIRDDEAYTIHLESIRPSPSNPRKRFDVEPLKELAASLKQTGLIAPIIVRPLPAKESHQYEIVAGERRFRAAQILGWKTIPCLIREMTDEQVLEVQCVENDQRVDVTPVERARAYKALRDAGLTITQIAQRVGRSETAIREALALTVLPNPLLDLVDAGHIAPTVASILVRVPDRLREDAGRALAMCMIFLPKLTDEDRKPNGSYGWATIAKRYAGSMRGPTLQEARQLMSSLVRDLRTAIWDWDHHDVGGMPPCTNCPNRERDISGGKDTCLDADCYTKKHDASRRPLPVIEETSKPAPKPTPSPTKKPVAAAPSPAPVPEPKAELGIEEDEPPFVNQWLSESSTAKVQRWAEQAIGNPFAISPDSDAWLAVVAAMTMYLADITMPYTPNEIYQATPQKLVVMASEIVATLAKFKPLPNAVKALASVGIDINKLEE